MMFGEGYCLTETFFIRSDDLVDLRYDGLVLQRRMGKVAVKRSDRKARLLKIKDIRVERRNGAVLNVVEEGCRHDVVFIHEDIPLTGNMIVTG